MTEKLTLQQVFDNAVKGIAGQNFRRSYNRHGCVYLNDEGDRCAIGHSIPSDMVELLQAKGGICDQLSGRFGLVVQSQAKKLFGHLDYCALEDMQAAHDNGLAVSKAQWFDQMRTVASAYNLSTATLDALVIK